MSNRRSRAKPTSLASPTKAPTECKTYLPDCTYVEQFRSAGLQAKQHNELTEFNDDCDIEDATLWAVLLYSDRHCLINEGLAPIYWLRDFRDHNEATGYAEAVNKALADKTAKLNWNQSKKRVATTTQKPRFQHQKVKY